LQHLIGFVALGGCDTLYCSGRKYQSSSLPNLA
jgi:hypothetical protein